MNFNPHGAVASAEFSPDGQKLVTAGWDHTARIWDLTTRKVGKELRGHTGRVYGAAFSNDGTLVITASEDRTAYIWDAREGHLLAELRGHAGAVHATAFSPDDAYARGYFAAEALGAVDRTHHATFRAIHAAPARSREGAADVHVRRRRDDVTHVGCGESW